MLPLNLSKLMNRKAGSLLRWMPFTVMAVISFCVAAGVGHPRKPMSYDLSLSSESVAFSLAKVKHYECIALFFFLALLGVGPRRAGVAFWISMAMGLGYELAEMTALGHTCRLADLIPDLLAALASLAVCLLARRGAKLRCSHGPYSQSRVVHKEPARAPVPRGRRGNGSP